MDIKKTTTKLFITILLIGANQYRNEADAQPANPPVPKENTPSCGLKYLTATTPPSAGISYYWQGTKCDSSVAKKTTSYPNYTVNNTCGTVTYYLRAKDSTNKWSTGCSSVDIAVALAAPCTPYANSSGYCGPNQTLTRNGNPPAGTAFYWQGTKCDTLTTNAAATYTTTATGIYYIRAKDSCTGKWSTCGSVTLNALPATPSGPTVSSPSCGLKTLSVTSAPSGVTYYWQDTISKGTNTAYSASSIYYIPDRCISTSLKYYLRARTYQGCWSDTSSSVAVTGSRADSLPCNPATPTTTNYTCGDQTLTRVTPVTGITYYWQGTSCDSVTTKGSGSTYTVSATGTYYLRARFTCTGKWSSGCSSVVSTIQNPLPTAPPNPTINIPSCGLKTLSVATAPNGVTYFWQGTNASGTSITNVGSSSYTVSDFCTTTPFVYYVRTKNNTSGCWSANSGSVSVADPIANSIPCNPPKPTTTNNTCGVQTLSVATPPGGITYYWQGTKCDSSITNPTSTPYTIAANGTYYVRTRHNCKGKWSTGCDSVASIFHNPLPATPPVPTLDSCGRVLKMPTAPSGVKYYWQGTSGCSSTTTNPATTQYTITTLGTNVTVYVKAQSDSGCFSASCATKTFNIPATPCGAPKVPPAPTAVTSKCTAILTRAVPPSSGIIYYWQGTSCGNDTTKSSLNYTATVNGTYYLKARDSMKVWSSTCSSVQVTISNIPSDPPVPTLNATCGIITMPTPPAGVKYYWQGTTACGNTTNNPASVPYVITTYGTSSITYYVKALNDTGCFSINCKSVTATIVTKPKSCGPPDPPAPTAVTVKCTATLTRAVPPSTGITYYWQGITCGGDSTNAAMTYTATYNGTYYLRARDSVGQWSNGCGAVVVAIANTPSTPPAPTVSSNLCGDKTLTRGTPATGITYYWQDTICGTDTTKSGTTYNVSASGTYYLKAKNDTGCWSPCSSVPVTIITVPTVNAGTDTSICLGTSATLNASSNVGGATYLWTPPTGSSDTTATTTVTASVTTTYTVIASSKGCSGSDSVTVTVVAVPVANAGTDTSMCKGKNTQLNVTGGITGSVYNWSPNTGLSDAAIANPVATSTATTSYKVSITNSGICADTDTVVITVNPLPTVVASATAASINCGDSTSLSAKGAVNYSWNPATGLNDITKANPVAKPMNTTKYIVTGTDANGCVNTDSTTLTIIPPKITATTARASISKGDTVSLFATGGTSYVWRPSTELDDSTKANPVAKPTATITYIVIGTTPTGCSGSDTIIITVNDENSCEPFIPNAFSPNGNQFNDEFRIRIKGDCFKEIYFVVYDRWGKKVFEKTDNDVTKGWDGTFEGNNANTGVYIYYLKATLTDDSVIEKKGNVSLIR